LKSGHGGALRDGTGPFRIAVNLRLAISSGLPTIRLEFFRPSPNVRLLRTWLRPSSSIKAETCHWEA